MPGRPTLSSRRRGAMGVAPDQLPFAVTPSVRATLRPLISGERKKLIGRRRGSWQLPRIRDFSEGTRAWIPAIYRQEKRAISDYCFFSYAFDGHGKGNSFLIFRPKPRCWGGRPRKPRCGSRALQCLKACFCQRKGHPSDIVLADRHSSV